MPCRSIVRAWIGAGSLAAFFTVALGIGLPAAGATDDAAGLLRASLEAPKSVSYVGQFQTVRFSTNRAVATIVKVEHRAPGLTRRWYVAPEVLYGDYVITRGGSTYAFETKQHKLTVSQNPAIDNQVSASENFSRVLENYRAVLGGNETVADRATVSVVLLNKYTGERVERVWIDRETHLVLKKEEYHGNGSVASQSRFDALRYTNSIPDGIFSTDAPSGYTQFTGQNLAMPSSDIEGVLKQAGFPPIEPKNLPQGFSVVSGDVTTVDGVRTLHLLYSDGLRSISLFENATGAAADFGSLPPKTVSFDNHDAQYVEDGPTTLLTWREEGLYFALVGDLMRNELITIAKSVVP